MPDELVKVSKEAKRNIQFFTVEGTTVISWRLPQEQAREIQASANVTGGGGKYSSKSVSEHKNYVHLSGIGLMPEKEWERRTRIANAISLEAKTQISPSDVSGVKVQELMKCPKCQEPLFVLSSGGCARCGNPIITR